MDNEIKNVGLVDYISNAKGKEPLDFKHRGMNDREEGVTVSQHHYRGMSFNGKVASARDIGNYAAGYVAGKHGFGWGSSRFAFDALQTKKKKEVGIRFCIIRLIELEKDSQLNKQNELVITQVILFLNNDNLKDNGKKQQTLIQQDL